MGLFDIFKKTSGKVTNDQLEKIISWMDSYKCSLPKNEIHSIGKLCYDLGAERINKKPHKKNDLIAKIIHDKLVVDAALQIESKLKLTPYHEWSVLNKEIKTKVCLGMLEGTIDFMSKAI
ncbi:hypothetical protein [Tenacibaculum piscium]|uniref:hypothetical protein n=1 Tax=Tenacibaculum piscium TaxID=1458515 RepID=UPI001F300892|nr:hypothetical protein [Tenacibaculum piscium]